MQIDKHIDSLLFWFETEKRKLPWRKKKRDPYSVFISEIMLQQTRAEVVCSYFKKWMKKYPSLSSLAKASEGEVIKMWEGLGYYSRARNLLFSAKKIMEMHGGKIPANREDLLKLKGMGAYTSAAILAFGYEQNYLAVDGNVARVLSRYWGIKENVSLPKTKKKLEELGKKLFPEKKISSLAEALIELGALVCKKKPSCALCPLQKGCVAFKDNLQDLLPFKNPKLSIIEKKRAVFLFVCNKKILLRKEKKGRVMADLYEFPYLELEGKEESKSLLVSLCQKQFLVKIERFFLFETLLQTFTRYRCTLFPLLVLLEKEFSHEGFEWVQLKDAERLPFSSAHRKLLIQIIKKGLR